MNDLDSLVATMVAESKSLKKKKKKPSTDSSGSLPTIIWEEVELIYCLSETLCECCKKTFNAPLGVYLKKQSIKDSSCFCISAVNKERLNEYKKLPRSREVIEHISIDLCETCYKGTLAQNKELDK